MGDGSGNSKRGKVGDGDRVLFLHGIYLSGIGIHALSYAIEDGCQASVMKEESRLGMTVFCFEDDSIFVFGYV